MSASQRKIDQAAAPAGDADHAREVLGFALLQSRQPGNDKIHGPIGTPRQLSEADVRALPKTELRERLDEIILSRRADRGLTVLYESGLLGAILPEVTALVGFGEGASRHKDVWRHTIQVVIQAVPRAAVRWGALLHDIGKPKTRSIAPDGSVHFLHHAEVGARMFKKLARREDLFDDDLAERLRFLVYHHQRAHQYDGSWTDSATRRFAREMGDALDDLMALSRADMTTKRKEKRRRFLFQLKELTQRIEKLQAEDDKPKALPKGLGEALITQLRLPPSKLIGDIRKELEVAVEAGELPLQADFATYIEFVRQHPDRFNLPEQARQPSDADGTDAL
jgi:poly(A) polymerase